MWWLKRKQDTKQRKEPYNTRQESLQTRWMKLGRTSCRHFKIREESRTLGYPFASCKSNESMLAFLAEHQQKVMRYQNCINWTKLKNEGLSEHEGQNQSNSWKRVKGFGIKYGRNCQVWLGFDFMLYQSGHSPGSSDHHNVLLYWKPPSYLCCCRKFPLTIKIVWICRPEIVTLACPEKFGENALSATTDDNNHTQKSCIIEILIANRIRCSVLLFWFYSQLISLLTLTLSRSFYLTTCCEFN